MTAVPVKGSVLKWARKFRGLDEAQAAERLGIAVADLIAYEQERKQPSVTLFEAFASKYRLPPATMFLLTPPDLPPEPADFRTAGGKKRQKRSFEFSVALSNIRTWLFYFEKLASDDAVFIPPKLPQLRISDYASVAE